MGRIKKLVSFSKMNSDPLIYNLGLADAIHETEIVDDITVTNNSDTEQVFSTVVQIVVDFWLRKGGSLVYITGSTPERTRLFQIRIASSYIRLIEEVELFGVHGGVIKEFKLNTNYEGFLAKPRETGNFVNKV